VAGYSLRLCRSAAKEIEGIARREDRRRVVRRIAALADDPRPHGSEKLAGGADLYRVRIGDWRVLCAIDDPRAIVNVVKVGHRRDVYR
jgi:mRNA interferase RelE/StbE